MCLTAVIKYGIYVPLLEASFFSLQYVTVLVVKLRITAAGNVPQPVMDLTRSAQLVPWQHQIVSPPKHRCDQKKEQIQEKQMFYHLQEVLLLFVVEQL